MSLNRKSEGNLCIAFHLFVEPFSGDAINGGEVGIEDHLLSAYGADAGFDRGSGSNLGAFLHKSGGPLTGESEVINPKVAITNGVRFLCVPCVLWLRLRACAVRMD